MAYADVDLPKGRITVTTRYEEKELVKSIPGSRYDGTAKTWSVPLTWTACLQLRGIFTTQLVISPLLNAWAADERRARITPVMELRTLLKPSEYHDPARANEKLYPFQQAGVDFLIPAESALLGDEMGTGKTIQLLDSLRTQHGMYQDTLPALVICPNSTKFNWAEETVKWFPEAKPYVITGGVVTRRRLFKTASEDPNALVIINIEAVRSHSRLAPYGSIHLLACRKCDPHHNTVEAALGGEITDTRCEKHIRELNVIPFQTVTVDEAHRMKDPRSKQTRAIWACGENPHVKHRYALTGTPIANDPSDLWSILHFLAPDEAPTKSKYVDRYCLQSWNAYGGLSVIGVQPQTRDEFHAVIGPRFRRVTKDEVLKQLPRKQRQLITVEMTPKQAKAYREMESGLATRVDGGVIVAASNLTAQIRLLQFAAATCEIDPDGKVSLKDPSPKVDALIDVVDAARGKPLVVAAEQRQLIELASKRLTKEGMEHGLITGAIDEWTRKETLKRFQGGQLPVLLFTIKAGGTGLNMTAADTIVFLQRSWSMVDNRQAEDRVHRIGSEVHESINVIDIVTAGTVEQTVMTRYLEKVHRLDQITQDRSRAKANGLDTTELDELEAFIMQNHLGEM